MSVEVPPKRKERSRNPSLCVDRLTSARHKQRLRRYLCFILFFILLDSLSSKSISFSSFKIHHAPKIAIGISASIKIVKSIIFVYLSLSFVAFIISLFYWFVKCFLRKYTKKPNFFTSPAFPLTLEVTKMSNKQVGYGLIKAQAVQKAFYLLQVKNRHFSVT